MKNFFILCAVLVSSMQLRAQSSGVIFSRTTYPDTDSAVIGAFRVNPGNNNLNTPYAAYLYSNSDIPRNQTLLVIVPRQTKMPVNFKIDELFLMRLSHRYKFSENEIKANFSLPMPEGDGDAANTFIHAKFLRVDSQYKPATIPGGTFHLDPSNFSIFAGQRNIGTLHEQFFEFDGPGLRSQIERKADVITDPLLANELNAGSL